MQDSLYKHLIQTASFGFAYHQILIDEEGKPIDYRFLEVNPAFEALTGLKSSEILGRSVTEVIPGIREGDFDWIEYYGKIALNGGESEFTEFSPPQNRWYKVQVASREKHFFTTLFVDITHERLHAQELEGFFAVNLDLLFVMDLEGRFIKINQEWEDLLGYSVEDLSGNHFIDYVHPEDLEPTQAALARLEESVHMVNFVCRYRTFKNEFRYIEWRLHRGTLQMYGAAKDITPQMEIEKNLRESEARHRLLAENTLDVIWTMDLSGKITYVSPSVEKLRGYAPKEVLAQSLDELFTPVSRSIVELFLVQIREALSQNRSFPEDRFEIEQPCKNKSTVWTEVNVSGLFSNQNTFEGILGVSRNIVDRKRALESAALQNRFQALVAEFSTDFISTTKLNIDSKVLKTMEKIGSFFEVDRSYLFEFSEDMLTMTNTHEWCRPGIEPQKEYFQSFPMYLMPWWTKMILGEAYITLDSLNELPPEAKIEKKEFERQGIQSLIAIPLMQKGRPIGFLGLDAVQKPRKWEEHQVSLLKVVANVFTEAQQKVQAEEALLKAIEMADAANRAKSEFLANMSHEIRTPLNAVIGFTDLIKNSDLDSDQAQFTDNAQVAARSLLGIINDILDFSKIEAGQMDLEILPCNISDIAYQATEMLRYQSSLKGLEMILDLDPDLPELLLLDSVRVKQILVNLMGNAIKFTKEGEVEISVRFQKHVETRGTLYISVRDTGIGIMPEQQDRIFQAFSQADNSTTRKFGGTGLGLVISKLLAEKMDGHISLESEHGKGTIFTLSLETEETQDLSAIKNRQKKLAAFSKFQNILLIDPLEVSRTIAKRDLTAWGNQVSTATTMDEAIKLLPLNHDFDLILLNHLPPLMDGLELVSKLSKNGHRPERGAYIVFIHRASDHVNIHKAVRSLGMSFRLTRPFRPQDLVPILENINKGQWGNQVLHKVESPSENPLAGTPTLLMAEDIAMNRLLLRTLVRKIIPHAKLLECANGQEVLDTLKLQTVDLILMDVHMPVLDGLEATRQIRREESTEGGHLPIIALTAGVLKEERENCFLAGVDDFLTKPLDSTKLRRTLLTHLEDRISSVGICEEEHLCDTLKTFNREALMEKIDNNFTVLQVLMEELKQLVPQQLESLVQSFEAQDIQAMKSVAHSLKGSALNMGLEVLGDLALQLEATNIQMRDEQKVLLDAMAKNWQEISTLINL